MASLSKILALLAFSLMLISTEVVAQQLFGSVGMVNAGYSSTHHARSPAETEVADSIQFGSGYTLLGAEGYYRNGKSIISLSGNIGVQASQFKGDKLIEPFLWNAHAGFGWLLSGDSRFCFYPMVGVGVNSLSITEYDRSTTDHKFVMRVTKPSADFSLHCDYLLLDSFAEGHVINGIALGAKIGYNCSILSPAQLHGWYFTVSVGGLAFMRKDR